MGTAGDLTWGPVTLHYLNTQSICLCASEGLRNSMTCEKMNIHSVLSGKKTRPASAVGRNSGSRSREHLYPGFQGPDGKGCRKVIKSLDLSGASTSAASRIYPIARPGDGFPGMVDDAPKAVGTSVWPNSLFQARMTSPAAVGPCGRRKTACVWRANPKPVDSPDGPRLKSERNTTPPGLFWGTC